MKKDNAAADSKKKPGGSPFWRRVKKEKELWGWTGFFMLWWVIFFLVPVFGIAYSFFNYTPGVTLSWDRFVGLKNYIQFFKTRDAGQIIRNTVVISGLNMTIGFVAPIILALLLDELKVGIFKKTVQTISYLPYFVSWVVVASIVITMLNSDGIVNEVIVKLGLSERPITFLTTGKYFWGLITTVTIWKSLGWNTILYMSAIAGIDQTLYEAAAVDGCSRWKMVKHIKIPGILPTIILLFILNIGNFLNLGYEQNLLLGQSTTRDYWEIIDTYVYRYGIQLGRYSFSIAVGVMKSIIGLFLIFISNHTAKKYSGYAVL